jgi:glycosyltransferase involved in cell wall biosynthesis
VKFIFDARFIRMDYHDGISRFSCELFRAISQLISAQALISDLRQLEQLPKNTKYILANKPTDVFGELLLARRLNRLGATHVYSPMQTMGSLGRKYKLILTQHDLIYYFHPKAPSALPLAIRIAWRIYHLNFMLGRFLLNRADAVVTVSETSKKLILENRLTKREVTVVYNAPDSSEVHNQQTAKPSPISRKLLYMGSFMDYKNVECLVAGLKHLPDFELVLLSKISEPRKAELLTLAAEAAPRVRFRNGVSEQEYAKELSEGFALVSASKDEGFGIPLVEAMQHGLPIVVSNLDIFREVAADAATYFDPNDPRDFSEAVLSITEETSWIKQSRLGLERSKFFDWRKSANVLLDLLKRL